MTRHDPSRRGREPHLAVRYQQQPGQVVGWPVATAAKWSGPPSVTAPQGEIPIRAGHDPGGVLSFAARGRGPDRAARVNPVSEADGPRRVRGRAHPTTDPPMNAGDPSGVTNPHPPPRARTRGRAAGGCAMGCATEAPQQERLRVKRGGPQRRSSRRRGELGATLWPSWSPVVRSAGSAAAPLASLGQLGRSGSSRQQCRRTNVHPAIGATGTGRADEHAETGWKRARLRHVTTPGRSPGVVTRTRPPDSAAGLRADGQTREAQGAPDHARHW
jgi:hypothetical protein